MNYRQVIEEAWEYTQNNKKLIFWLGFIPSFFTTTVGVGYIVYQVLALKKSYLFNDQDESFLHDVVLFLWTFISDHFSWTVPLIIIAAIFGIIYFLLPTLARAGAIQFISRQRNGQKVGVSMGLRYGVMSFLPLFEYHLIMKYFSFFTILIEISFVLRNLGTTIFELLLPVLLVMIIVGLVLTLLFTYADFFIIIDGCGVFQAMKNSARLVILSWRHTFLITILMMLIGVRIVIQAILVFLIPALVILISGYIATVTLPAVGVIVGGSVGLIGLLIAAYINGTVDIFSYSVWTFTFLDLTSQRELSAREKAE